ncbi:MAG: hypothetical protein ACR2K2_12210 [Mycobacteriales bacterium]
MSRTREGIVGNVVHEHDHLADGLQQCGQVRAKACAPGTAGTSANYTPSARRARPRSWSSPQPRAAQRRPRLDPQTFHADLDAALDSAL